MSTGMLIALLVVSVLLIASVLMQQQSAGLGGAFGSDSLHHQRRGAEKYLFYATIALSLVLALLIAWGILGA
ncbi:MAG: preprotein translocase subunit SecG [Patescibacteria group bacterium]